MAMAELGTASNPAADSCRVYSYYVGVNPSACSETPSSWPAGTNNNVDVAGYFYQDSMNALGHAATYGYDPVNRLISAGATGNSVYSQTFTYDAYGNLNCSPSGPGCVALTYNAATNRITTSGYAYDAAGNLTGDGANTYQWDAESHLTKAVNGAGVAISTNTYNALGQRVRDVTQTTTTDEAYGADGSLLWRYTGSATDPNQRAFVPFEGGILAEYYGGSPGGTLFDHPDELGSLSTAIDYATSHSAERLFYPFGEMWTGSDLYSLGMHQEFAKLPDYDNDANSDLYNTLNRHYTPMGRWLTPDPDNARDRPSEPQTWNMYAYVRNNPTTLTDPTGERYRVCQTDENGEQTNCADISDAQFAQFQQANKDTLTFTGGSAGNIYQNGTIIGSFQQTSVDATAGLIAVGTGTQMAAPIVEPLFKATMGFIMIFGLGTLDAETPEPLGSLSPGKTVADVLQGATPEGGSRTDIYSKPGGMQQAQKDFNDLAGGNPEVRGPVQIKELGDGRRAVLRDFSTDGRPTLEIQPPGGGYKQITIRYN
jgi:RHS repeat-associated protein